MPLTSLPVLPRNNRDTLDYSVFSFGRDVLEMDLPDHLPADCYAVHFPEGTIAEGKLIFSSSGKESESLEKIFCIGFHHRPYEICKVLRNEAPNADSPLNDPAGATRTRRKSFMTPTPLHIPTSRVSPIPGATHEALLIKPLSGGQARMVTARDVAWMHPLVHWDPEEMQNVLIR